MYTSSLRQIRRPGAASALFFFSFILLNLPCRCERQIRRPWAASARNPTANSRGPQDLRIYIYICIYIRSKLSLISKSHSQYSGSSGPTHTYDIHEIVSKETYLVSKETYLVSKETYLRTHLRIHMIFMKQIDK